jgi:hypothetical protein
LANLGACRHSERAYVLKTEDRSIYFRYQQVIKYECPAEMEVPPLWSTIFFRQSESNNGKIEITRVIPPSFSHLPLGNGQEKLSADSLSQLAKTLPVDTDFSCAPALSLLPFAVDGRGKNKRRERDIIQLEEQVLARQFLQDNPTVRRDHLFLLAMQLFRILLLKVLHRFFS